MVTVATITYSRVRMLKRIIRSFVYYQVHNDGKVDPFAVIGRMERGNSRRSGLKLFQ